MFNNKKADERYLSPWLFIIWIGVAVSIVLGIIIFAPFEADTRPLESELLANRIVSCYMDNFDISKKDSFDVYSICNLSKSVLGDNDLYYFSVEIKDMQNKTIYFFSDGNGVFKTQCNYQKIEKNEKNFAKCSFKISPLNNQQYKISVVAASNQK